VPHRPDFLWRLVALIHSMRLSLMKGAHADLSSTAWQEIGVKPFLPAPAGRGGLEWDNECPFPWQFGSQVISGACIAPESDRID
jgi:hypothetical protein